ncbi:hypothetical protein PybrP1_011075 [[Pythium] brassicae (nom. inval.)]|nr:hypothetical protein PybrP1_011075 [[Pythium] brassicae (nom. inval.)]
MRCVFVSRCAADVTGARAGGRPISCPRGGATAGSLFRRDLGDAVGGKLLYFLSEIMKILAEIEEYYTLGEIDEGADHGDESEEDDNMSNGGFSSSRSRINVAGSGSSRSTAARRARVFSTASLRTLHRSSRRSHGCSACSCASTGWARRLPW